MLEETTSSFSGDTYLRNVKEYDRVSRATDETLYDLCRRYPGHGDEGGVNAKLWIIGRTYATGIERKIRANGKQGGSMSQLAGHLLKNAGKLDALFAHLPQIPEPLEPAKLRTIIDVHGQFIALLQELKAMRPGQSPRSFASKYMHFHCPAVPIIDTYADRALRKLVRWQESFRLFNLPTGADSYYAGYVFRFWQLYQQALAAGVQPTVKHLDNHLLCIVEGKA